MSLRELLILQIETVFITCYDVESPNILWYELFLA